MHLLGFLARVLFCASVCSFAASPFCAERPAQTYAKCQKLNKDHPLQHCPRDTIYVAQDDSRASFSSIQDAIISLGNNTHPYIILIAPGDYYEQLNITRPGPVTLLGMSDRPLNGELYADIDYNTKHNNSVRVFFNLANIGNDKLSDNVYTSVLNIGPTLQATLTGSGPTGLSVPDWTPYGCADFRAYNVDFWNNEFDFSNGPAHAVGVSRANAGFYSCGLYSYQDTLYVGKLGNAFFYDSIIAGQTYFLYGFGTAWIERSHLALRNCGGGITAWKGTNTNFTNKYGVYIANTKVQADNTTILQVIKGKCALGRPWNALHRSIFMKSSLDSSILPAGYISWSGDPGGNVNGSTLLATYRDSGPGYNLTAETESKITVVLDKKGVFPYKRPADVFATQKGRLGNVWWIDQSVLPSKW